MDNSTKTEKSEENCPAATLMSLPKSGVPYKQDVQTSVAEKVIDSMNENITLESRGA